MPAERATLEQQAVVSHPFGRHARVLAVAGSGKTTTMVYRIDYLVRHKSVNPAKIRILMFNTLARRQFKEKLDEVGVPQELQPQVHNFHSLSYQFIQEMIVAGLLPGTLDPWVDDKEEKARICVHRAIENLAARGSIDPDSVDIDDCTEAISLWKGSLIPPLPARAGYRGNAAVPLVYAEFEQLRMQEGGLTFDDFVPMAVGALESMPLARQRWYGTADFIIVDEYQDVNYGQQRLIELLAGTRADVMVVGDDDQTIYEWRGARPDYIIREFRNVFSNKPHDDYTLSRSFRFGPVLAQSAENAICFNANRIPKPLIAHFPAKPAYLDVLLDTSEQSTDVSKDLAQQVVAMVQECRDPRKVIVLGRMFSQMCGLEAEFLAQGIPYRVLGRKPFFERRELRVLLDYFRLAAILDEPASRRAYDLLRSVANMPNRKLSREKLSRAMERALESSASTRAALDRLASAWNSPLSRGQRAKAGELLELLDRVQEILTVEAQRSAGELLTWLVDALDYSQHFDNYYGKGESSDDRKRAVHLFCVYAQGTSLGMLPFIRHVEQLDPTRGQPEEQQICMTTVFRTKGLEYDYVVIPGCTEGYMPYLFGTGSLVYDKAGIVTEPEPSEIIENERRLFYVAITRAKKGVLIGGSSPPVMGSQGKSTPSRPSRFLYEIQHEPTVAVMRPLQRLAAGEPTARSELRTSVERHGSQKAVIHNLTARYLPDLSEHSFAAEVSGLAAQIPPAVFNYPHQYDSAPQTGGSPAKRNLHTQEPQWWDDDS